MGFPMDEREAAISKSMRIFEEFLPDVWDGDKSERLGGLFRHFSESVVGLSALRLLPHLDRLKQAADGTSVRLVRDGKGRETLQVANAAGAWFGISSETQARPPRRDGDGDVEVIDLVISRPDPDNLDYAYPERIAFATVVSFPDRQHANGVCTLGDFGHCVDALQAFAAAAGLDLAPVSVQDLVGKNIHRMSDSNEVLALDGGVVGEACREAAARMSEAVADRIMRRAEVAFAPVADALEAEGIAWERGHLMFNDLDNSVTVLPEQGGRGRAVIHRNGSYISEYRTYVLEQSADGKSTSLYALEDGTDDFRAYMQGRGEGAGGPVPVATLAEGKLSLRQQFDETDVIGAMGFGLRCIEEIVLQNDRRDATIESGTDVFDTRNEDDMEDDGASPSP